MEYLKDVSRIMLIPHPRSVSAVNKRADIINVHLFKWGRVLGFNFHEKTWNLDPSLDINEKHRNCIEI